MSSKRLLPLAAVLVVLVAVALMVKRQPAPTRLVDEVGWERLVPDTLRAESVTGVDMYQGSQPDQVLSLRRQGDGWQVPTYFDAPVRPSRIESLLEQIGTLEGELRADRDELVREFELEDEQALHMRVYAGDQAEPVLHLLAGKSGRRSGFVRVAGDSRVYNVDLNLHSMAGLWGEKLGGPPEAETWLQLRLNDIRSEEVAAVELQSPRGHFRFVRAEPEEIEAAEGEPETAVSWRSEAPDVDYEVNQQLLDRLAVALGTLRADDIADGSQMSEYGLEDGDYRAGLTVKGGDEATRVVKMKFGREVPGADMDGARYAVLEERDTVYVVPGWSFRQLFPKGKTLFRLPGLKLKKEDVQEIALYTPDGTVRLSRAAEGPGAAPAGEGGETPPVWQVDEPPLGFPVKQDGVDALAEFLSRFVPDGLAPENGVAVPAAESVPRVEITMSDASRRLIHLSSESGGTAGQVVYVSGQDMPFIIEDATREELFPTLGTLMDLPMLPIQPDDVVALAWQDADGSWELRRQGGVQSDPETPVPWQFANAPDTPVNTQGVGELLVTTASLVADNWLDNPTAAVLDDPLLVVTLTRVDGARARVTVGQQVADSKDHLVRFEGAPGLFVLSSDTYVKLAEALAKVRPGVTLTPPAEP